ncbi:hypothetical protein KIW84_012840, partial [Lathyrus oleraceus]
RNYNMSSKNDENEHCCGTHFWFLVLMCWVFMAFAAISSALALGLLSFSQVDLEVLIKAGQPQIQKNAAKIMSIVKNEHLILCTLLMAKSLALEGVSVLMEEMFPEWVSVLLAAAIVSIIAEVIPQALNSRYGLRFGATMSPFVRVLLLLFFPVAYPISKLLDYLLGKGHTALLGREELKILVNLHTNEAGKGGELSLHETRIIAGALDLTTKTAKDVMTPLTQTFSLDINSKLDMHTMGMIMSKGHSRIPIFSGKQTNIIGLILVKNLMFCRPEDETPIKFMTVRRVPIVGENWPLYDILNQFKKGQSHMAVVLKEKIRNVAIDTQGVVSFLPLDYISISTEASNLQSEESEYYSATLKNVMLQESSDSDPLHKSIQHDTSTSSLENMESFLTDEEVVGIITLEDVMEEILQYHHKIATSKKRVIRVFQKSFNFSSTTKKFRCSISSSIFISNIHFTNLS